MNPFQNDQGWWFGGQQPIRFPAMGNLGDVTAWNLNTAAAMYPHLWAAVISEQARRDRENRAALEQALRMYANQANWMWQVPWGYEVPRFW